MAIAVAFALVVGARGTAFAHATLVSAEPAAGLRLGVCPRRVRLLFSEEIEPSLARIAIVAGDGHSTALVVGGDPHDVHAVIAPVGCLGAGSYRVAWRVVSADGHPVGGSYVFSLGAGTTSVPRAVAFGDETVSQSQMSPSVAGAPAVPALVRGLALGTLMSFAGLLFFSDRKLGVFSASGAPGSRLAMWLGVLAPLLLIANFALWVMNADAGHLLSRDSISAATASGVGRVEIWRVALAMLALWALALVRRPRLALFLAIAALLVSGASGHSAALHPAWAIPAKALHLIAGAAWIGGLLWLIVLDHTDAMFAAEAARVSSVALVAVVAVTISGVVQSLLFLATPLDLVRSAYGAIILAKIAGTLLLIAFGAYHRYRVLPFLSHDRPATSHFVATLRSELVVMSLVVLLGGLLAYVPPAVPTASAVNSSHSSE